MSHQHSRAGRPRRFRAYVTNQYYANRDEYDQHAQQQPHSFNEYVRDNLEQLKQEYRMRRAATRAVE